MFNVPRRYVPSFLTKKDKKKQSKALRRSRRAYKKGKYYTRKKVKSFKSKVSPHVVKAKKMYKINKISASKNLARKTKCKVKGLRKIVKKGQGAYYSSGSRPNQTGHSWGRARLASSITGGKASAVDFKILLENCSKKSKALRLAKRARTKYNKGRRRVKQVKIGGRKTKKRRTKMKETILEFKRGPFPIHFGDRRYQQFKDRTKVGLYSHKNHGTRRRMRNYFNRHSGTPHRAKAIKKEIRHSKGYYTAKILSHKYLW